MSQTVTIPDNAWIVVADGTGARLFAASVQGESVSLDQLKDLEPADPVHSGPSGQLPPEQTNQQKDEATFAHRLAGSLYSLAHAGRFDNLVVIADPQTLGQLRDIFHKEVTQRIVAEFPKTLTNLSVNDLEDALGSLAVD